MTREQQQEGPPIKGLFGALQSDYEEAKERILARPSSSSQQKVGGSGAASVATQPPPPPPEQQQQLPSRQYPGPGAPAAGVLAAGGTAWPGASANLEALQRENLKVIELEEEARAELAVALQREKKVQEENERLRSEVQRLEEGVRRLQKHRDLAASLSRQLLAAHDRAHAAEAELECLERRLSEAVAERDALIVQLQQTEEAHGPAHPEGAPPEATALPGGGGALPLPPSAQGIGRAGAGAGARRPRMPPVLRLEPSRLLPDADLEVGLGVAELRQGLHEFRSCLRDTAQRLLHTRPSCCRELADALTERSLAAITLAADGTAAAPAFKTAGGPAASLVCAAAPASAASHAATSLAPGALWELSAALLAHFLSSWLHTELWQDPVAWLEAAVAAEFASGGAAAGTSATATAGAGRVSFISATGSGMATSVWRGAPGGYLVVACGGRSGWPGRGAGAGASAAWPPGGLRPSAAERNAAALLRSQAARRWYDAVHEAVRREEEDSGGAGAAGGQQGPALANGGGLKGSGGGDGMSPSAAVVRAAAEALAAAMATALEAEVDRLRLAPEAAPPAGACIAIHAALRPLAIRALRLGLFVSAAHPLWRLFVAPSAAGAAAEAAEAGQPLTLLTLLQLVESHQAPERELRPTPPAALLPPPLASAPPRYYAGAVPTTWPPGGLDAQHESDAAEGAPAAAAAPAVTTAGDSRGAGNGRTATATAAAPSPAAPAAAAAAVAPRLVLCSLAPGVAVMDPDDDALAAGAGGGATWAPSRPPAGCRCVVREAVVSWSWATAEGRVTDAVSGGGGSGGDGGSDTSHATQPAAAAGMEQDPARTGRQRLQPPQAPPTPPRTAAHAGGAGSPPAARPPEEGAGAATCEPTVM
ncbi:hypothetical protein GPECTOR_43g908 [Gonium pectorale]|uniref:Uncharacterized protein n=1 Tax=Gonium pectorale TaxID=33097 RepID=A0A150G9F6_GONPE|nr:hypothetical protein GPECTOR_43g908 [Gonium pectorale]|eukprot:KXZ46472.1 hypothetical protein GPECTOR_43g908 [Gonium pectorale]